MWRCIAIALLLIWIEPAAAQQLRPSIDCPGAQAGAEIQEKGHTLPNPFSSSSDHYSVRALAVGGRSIMLARPIVYWPPAKSWETSDTADSPQRIFFEVQKGGTIKAMCSFAGPYYLGAQL